MELIVLSVTFMAILVLQTWFLWRLMKSQQSQHRTLIESLMESQNKAMALIASRDPMTFQQIQAMDQTSLKSSELNEKSDDEIIYEEWVTAGRPDDETKFYLSANGFDV